MGRNEMAVKRALEEVRHNFNHNLEEEKMSDATESNIPRDICSAVLTVSNYLGIDGTEGTSDFDNLVQCVRSQEERERRERASEEAERQEGINEHKLSQDD